MNFSSATWWDLSCVCFIKHSKQSVGMGYFLLSHCYTNFRNEDLVISGLFGLSWSRTFQNKLDKTYCWTLLICITHNATWPPSVEPEVRTLCFVAPNVMMTCRIGWGHLWLLFYLNLAVIPDCRYLSRLRYLNSRFDALTFCTWFRHDEP